MILDTSAVVAIVFQEPGWESLFAKLDTAPAVGVGTPTLAETAIVMSSRLNRDARALLSRFLLEGSVAAVPFHDGHFGIAVDAWLRYGKGRHAARLNFGDCLAYATAKLAAQPLLCTGGDFSKTDIELAL